MSLENCLPRLIGSQAKRGVLLMQNHLGASNAAG